MTMPKGGRVSGGANPPTGVVGAEEMRLIVAEYAAANHDGTFTVIRGGIENLTVPSLPADFSASVLIDVAAGAIPSGFQKVDVSVRDALGLFVFRFSGTAVISKPDETVRAAIHIGGKIATAGPLVIQAQFGLETAQQVVNVQLKAGE